MKRLRVIAASLCLAAGAAHAEQGPYVAYTIDFNIPTVKGAFVVNGYSPSQIMAFIAEDCKSGLGQMKLIGKPRKKRDYFVQKFSTVCQGGLSPKYDGIAAKFDIQRLPNGSDAVKVKMDNGKGRLVQFNQTR